MFLCFYVFELNNFFSIFNNNVSTWGTTSVDYKVFLRFRQFIFAHRFSDVKIMQFIVKLSFIIVGS